MQCLLGRIDRRRLPTGSITAPKCALIGVKSHGRSDACINAVPCGEQQQRFEQQRDAVAASELQRAVLDHEAAGDGPDDERASNAVTTERIFSAANTNT